MTERDAVTPLPPPPDRLERYVLGLLDEAEREVIEARAFDEPTVAAAIDVAETDLVDAWVSGTLDGEASEAFARALADRDRLRARVDVARALARGRARTDATSAHDDAAPRRPWLIGLAAAAVLLVSVALWFARSPSGSTSSDNEPPITSTADDRRDQPPVARDDTAPTPPPDASPALEAPAPRPTPVVFAVRLPSATTRAAAVTRVEVPADATHVRFAVRVAEGDDFARYGLAVSDRAGRVVASAEHAALAPDRLVAIVVARTALRDGLHEVALVGRSPDDAEEPLAILQVEVLAAARP